MAGRVATGRVPVSAPRPLTSDDRPRPATHGRAWEIERSKTRSSPVCRRAASACAYVEEGKEGRESERRAGVAYVEGAIAVWRTGYCFSSDPSHARFSSNETEESEKT